jgi:acid stress chaperone HdeB
LVVSGLVSVLATVPSARAQVTLDVSKITCEQLAGYKIHQSSKYRDLVKRLSQRQARYTTIETQKLIANAKALQKYCIQNPQTLVMSAVETLFGADR